MEALANSGVLLDTLGNAPLTSKIEIPWRGARSAVSHRRGGVLTRCQSSAGLRRSSSRMRLVSPHSSEYNRWNAGILPAIVMTSANKRQAIPNTSTYASGLAAWTPLSRQEQTIR